jgi:hypothetical protein
VRYRQDFALVSNAIRFAGERPCEMPGQVQDLAAAGAAKPSGRVAPGPTAPPPAKPSLLERVKSKLHSWFRKK